MEKKTKNKLLSVLLVLVLILTAGLLVVFMFINQNSKSKVKASGEFSFNAGNGVNVKINGEVSGAESVNTLYQLNFNDENSPSVSDLDSWKQEYIFTENKDNIVINVEITNLHTENPVVVKVVDNASNVDGFSKTILQNDLIYQSGSEYNLKAGATLNYTITFSLSEDLDEKTEKFYYNYSIVLENETDEPGTEEPDPDEPGTEEPDPDEPGTEEPGEEPTVDIVSNNDKGIVEYEVIDDQVEIVAKPNEGNLFLGLKNNETGKFESYNTMSSDYLMLLIEVGIIELQDYQYFTNLFVDNDLVTLPALDTINSYRTYLQLQKENGSISQEKYDSYMKGLAELENYVNNDYVETVLLGNDDISYTAVFVDKNNYVLEEDENFIYKIYGDANVAVIQELKNTANREIVIPEYFNGNIVAGIDAGFDGSGTAWNKNLFAKKITLPDTFLIINPFCFGNNVTLEEIVIPSSIKEISFSSFSACSSLKKVTFEEGSQLKEIGMGCFTNCALLESVQLPNTVEKIGMYAFALTNLSALPYSMDSNIKYIGEYAFQHCYNIRTLYLPNNVETVGIYAFDECCNSKGTSSESGKIILQEELSLKELPEYIFQDCDMLEEIVIPYGIEKIGNGTFYNCNPKKIVISETVKEIGERAFYFSQMSYGKGEEIIFEGNSQLETIGKNAFSSFGKVENLTIPSSVKTIGDNAFNGVNINKLMFGDNAQIESIGSRAFSSIYEYENTKSCTLPETINYLGADAFWFYKTQTITFTNPEPAQISTSIFLNNVSKIYVPTESVEAYKTADVWSTYADKIFGVDKKVEDENLLYHVKDDGTLEIIANKTVSGLRLVIPESVEGKTVTSIASKALSNLNVQHLVIPKTIKEIGKCGIGGEFRSDNTSSLISIWIDENSQLENVGEYAFGYNQNLVSINLENANQLQYIGKYAFYYCTSLQSMTLPSSLLTVAEGMLSNCSSIKEINIDANATLIESSAFSGCSNLNIINFEEGSKMQTINGAYFAGSQPNVIILNTENVPTFEGTIDAKTTKIYVPTESVETYKTADVWSTYADKIIGIDKIIKDENFIYEILDDGNLELVMLHNFDATKISIPETFDEKNITTIGAYAFSSTKLTNLELPATITSIKDYAFYNLTNLNILTLNMKTLPTITNNTLNNLKIESNDKIYVPTESIDLYKTSGQYLNFNYWSSYSNYIFGLEQRVYDENFEYFVKEDGTLQVYALINKNLVDVVVPGSVDGKVVTTIGQDLFKDNTTIETVTFTKGLVEIEKNAFSGCSSLREINFVSTLTTIGNYAFYNCSSLQELTLPNTEISIGSYAFSGCDSIVSLVIPSTITTIKDHAFAEMDGLNMVEFEDGSMLTQLGTYVFSNNTNLQSVSFGDNSSLEVLGQDIFYSCQNLTTVDFGMGTKLEEIGASAFSNCKNLTNILIPASVESIGDYAFKGTNITNINIPASVQTIGTSAFADCENLSSVTFEGESTIQTIGNYAFKNTNLKTIELPASLTTFNDYAFYNCSNLANITLLGAPPSINGSSGLNSINAIYVKIDYYEDYLSSSWSTYSNKIIAIEEKISDGDFIYRKIEGGLEVFVNLKPEEKTLIIPSSVGVDNVISIKENLFAQNTNLVGVKIPATVQKIGDSAFAECRNLSILEIEKNSQLTYIGNSAFKNTKITKISIPENVVEIADYAFQNNQYEFALKDIDFSQATSLKTIGQNAFEGSGVSEIVIPASVETIGQNAFYNCINATKVIFENNIPPTISSNTLPQSYNFSFILVNGDDTVETYKQYCAEGLNGWTSQYQDMIYSKDRIIETTNYYVYLNENNEGEIIKFKSASVEVLEIPEFIDGNKIIGLHYDAGSTLMSSKVILGSETPIAIENDIFMNVGMICVPNEEAVALYKQYCLENTNGWKPEYADKIYNINNIIENNTMTFYIKEDGTLNLLNLKIESNTKEIVIPSEFSGKSVSEISVNLLAYLSLDINIIFESNEAPIINNFELPQTQSAPMIYVLSNEAVSNYRYKCENSLDGWKPEYASLIYNKNNLGTYQNIKYYKDVDNTVTILGVENIYVSSLTIPDEIDGAPVTKLADSAFMGSSFNSVTLPTTLMEIGNNAFFYCMYLTSVNFEDCTQLKSIGNSAFAYCINLNSVNLENCTQLESIGDMAFISCSVIDSITIPSSVSSIGNSAFSSTGLTSVTFVETEGWQVSQDGQNDWQDLEIDLSVQENALNTLTNTYAGYYWRRVQV